MPPGLTALQQALGWLHVLISLAGVAVCASNLRRSRWVWVLLAGFGLDALVSAGYRTFSLLVGSGALAYSRLGLLFLMLSLLGLLGSAAIVGGLAALLAERGTPPAAAAERVREAGQ